ncbi:hypothetical protein JCM19298_604 [Nonlabens ulvanivorans]|nr:hypothetical protein JCM19298_604 [Nonlabens ulvanivorans]
MQKRNGERKVLENVLLKALRKIEKEKPFDKEFQQAAFAYLKGNIAIVKNDYAQLLKADLQQEPALIRLLFIEKYEMQCISCVKIMILQLKTMD